MRGLDVIQDYSNATVCVVDNGMFADLATTLTKFFGRVLLNVPAQDLSPTSARLAVGQGLARGTFRSGNFASMAGNGVTGVEKIDDVLLMMDEIDLFIFPNSYSAELQVYLRQCGKNVFGSALGEELELDRVFAKKVMKEAGLPIGSFEVVRGTDALRRRLKQRPGVVKISYSRGDKETFTSKNYFLSDLTVSELEYKLGPLRHSKEFLVEDVLPKDEMIELGCDLVVIDGQYSSGLVGLEVKDVCYLAKFVTKDRIPAPLRIIQDGLASTLREFQYRNFFSDEVLIERPRSGTPGKGYLIDPTCRWGVPPGELMQRMFGDSLPDIFWFGARGELVEPTPVAQWGAQLNLICENARERWTAFQYPPELRDRLFFSLPVVVDGQMYSPPAGEDSPVVCAALGWGDTMEAAIADVQRVAQELQGHTVEARVAALEEAATELRRLPGEFGITL